MSQPPTEDAWDKTVLGFDHPSVLQSAAWGDFKARWGWRVERVAWQDPPVAAQILIKGLALGGRFAYVPHGPLLDQSASTTEWQEALRRLTEWARSNRAVLLKLELDIPDHRDDVVAALRAASFTRSHEAIQFPNTMLTDLTPGLDQLWSALRQKTRYNVVLSRRRGITVREGDANDIDAFWSLYRETAERDGFAIRERAYYEDAWLGFLESGRGALLLAESGGDPVAGALPVHFGGTAFYMYGASASRNRRDMPAYAVQWESLSWAHRSGCDRYDWWGAPSSDAPDDPLLGVAHFKAGFGAAMAPRLGPWDAGLIPGTAAAYRVLTGLRRRSLTWRAR